VPSSTVQDGLRSALRAMEQSVRLMRLFPPARVLLSEEIENKLLALRLFYFAQDELGLAKSGTDIDEAARIAGTREAFQSIWMMEGAAYRYARSGGRIRHAQVPERYFIPLHAGAGMAFAQSAIGALPQRPGRQALSQCVEGFLERCRSNARPGWEEAIFESLGLIVRLERPELLGPLSDASEAIDPELRALFWHGAGRGLYFAPGAMTPLPGAHGWALDKALKDAPRPGDKRNAVAGYSWAVTLVNVRHPESVSSLLARCVAVGVCEPFTNGFISALLAWKHMAPADEPWVARFTRPFSGAVSSAIWDKFAAAPALAALESILPGLLRNNAVAKLFAFQTGAELGLLASAVTCAVDSEAIP
jgi:hypothetical protein